MYLIVVTIAVLFVLFIIMQFITIRMANTSKGTTLKELEGDLKVLEGKGSKGIVYFHSPACGACRAQTPVIKEMQNTYPNVFDIDISKNMKAAQVFGIKATPTTVSVEDGVIKEVLLGAKPRSVIEKLLQNTI